MVIQLWRLGEVKIWWQVESWEDFTNIVWNFVKNILKIFPIERKEKKKKNIVSINLYYWAHFFPGKVTGIMKSRASLNLLVLNSGKCSYMQKLLLLFKVSLDMNTWGATGRGLVINNKENIFKKFLILLWIFKCFIFNCNSTKSLHWWLLLIFLVSG